MEQRPRRALMERELLNSAAELFSRNGFEGTSLGEIAETAGVGRTTPYHYFESKEDFLAALVENVTAAALTDLRALKKEKHISSHERLNRATRALVAHALDNPVKFRVLVRNEASLPPKLLKRHVQMKRDAFNEVVAIIDAGIENGEFRGVDVRIAALAIFGMSNWAAWWFNPTGEKSAAEVAASIADLAIHAVARQKNDASSDQMSIIGAIRADLNILERIARKDKK